MNQEKFYEYGKFSWDVVYPIAVSVFLIVFFTLTSNLFLRVIYAIYIIIFGYGAWHWFFMLNLRLTWPKIVTHRMQPFENRKGMIHNTLLKKPYYEHIINHPGYDETFTFKLYGSLVILDVIITQISGSEKQLRKLGAEKETLETKRDEIKSELLNMQSKELDANQAEAEAKRAEITDTYTTLLIEKTTPIETKLNDIEDECKRLITIKEVR